MARLSSLSHGEWQQFERKLDGSDLTAEEVRAIIENPELIASMLVSLRAKMAQVGANPFALTVEEQLQRFWRANVDGCWGLSHEVVQQLEATAPKWPDGKLAFRSLRIRFGEGSEGVAKTFELHAAQVKAVFGEKGYWRWDGLTSGEKKLRLLNGDNTHKPVVEWVCADLDANRKRDSITAVRGPKSLADELLVIAWIFPDLIRAINYGEIPGFFAGGYEASVPGRGPWTRVPIVLWRRGNRQVELITGGRGLDDSDDSVPVLRE